jgi:hypothetical protein
MDKATHNSGEKYDNEEDRRNGLFEAKRRYGNQSWQCETCDVIILRGNKGHHLKSKKHKSKTNVV